MLTAQFSHCFSLWAEVTCSLGKSTVWLQICHTRLPSIHPGSVVVLGGSKSKYDATVLWLAELQQSVPHTISPWRRLISSSSKHLILPNGRLKGTDHYKAQVEGARRAIWRVGSFRDVQKSAGLSFAFPTGPWTPLKLHIILLALCKGQSSNNLNSDEFVPVIFPPEEQNGS